ncbi:MAG: hypothetical protein H5U21_04945 [Porphyrobacter sp.]|nr:hypothetical protein [Porphyrobacter sp.]
MTMWAAIVLIAAIFAVASVLRSGHSARRSDPSDEAGDPRLEAELRREIAELRERVQVLERIATDNPEARRLSAEIDRLRDQP